jgi:hypothetical protein
MSQESLRAELIKHLSSEIGAQTEYINTLRSRMAFAVLVGPFAVLGSALIATKGELCTPTGILPWVAISVAGLCYLGLGFYGARLDEHVTQQCNAWQGALLSVVNEESTVKLQIQFQHSQNTAYLAGFVLLLGALAGTAVFVLKAIPAK